MILVNFLTANHIFHILYKTMDVEGLRRRYPSLIPSEPTQPLKYHLDVLSSQEQLLDKGFCVAYSGTSSIMSHLMRTH